MRRLFLPLALACLLFNGGLAQPARAAGPITFTLTSQNGEVVTEQKFAGRYMLAFFGYTHCPDICPTTLNDLSILSGALPAEIMAKLSVVFVTGDPQRDTPAVLKDYLSSFDGRIMGLSGSLEQTDALAWSMKAVVIRHGNGQGEYTVDHSTNYILVHDGVIIDQIPNTLTTEEMVARLSAIIKD